MSAAKSDPDKLTLRLVPLEDCRRWDKNPKRHSLPSLQDSIRRYGFVDPPHYDSALEALVYGNGRAEALALMQEAGEEVPRGIVADKAGKWKVPILFGVDQESREKAEALGVDHNTLTMAGAGFEAVDFDRLFDEESLAALVGSWTENGNGFGGLVLDCGGLFTGVEPLGEMPSLPTGDRSPFQQMTFTVSDEQAETIKAALGEAKKVPFGDTGNDNSNGNALARIAEAYRG